MKGYLYPCSSSGGCFLPRGKLNISILDILRSIGSYLPIVDGYEYPLLYHVANDFDLTNINELDEAKEFVHLAKLCKEYTLEKRRELLLAFSDLFPQSLMEDEDCIKKGFSYVPEKEIKKREKKKEMSKQISLFAKKNLELTGKELHIDSEGMWDPAMGSGLLSRMCLSRDLSSLEATPVSELAQDLQCDLYSANVRNTKFMDGILALQQENEKLLASSNSTKVDCLTKQVEELKWEK